jgi:hypothetical protein
MALDLEDFLEEQAEETRRKVREEAAVLAPVERKLDEIIRKLDWFNTRLARLERKNGQGR